MKVTIENIRKSYDDNIVLDGIDLEIHAGSIVGLLGRNGVGKSTLLKIISGIMHPDEGQVVRHSQKVGFLSEKNPLYPHFYVREYLLWLCHVQDVRNANERVEWVLSSTGLSEVRNKLVLELSKGYRQRLGIGSLLISDPDIIILDEPISGLDPIQISEYRNLIRNLSKNKVVILSSHLLQEIEALCDRVIVLHNGVVHADQDVKRNKEQKRLQTNGPLDIQQLKVRDEIADIIEISPTVYTVKLASHPSAVEVLFDEVVGQNLKILELKDVDTDLQQMFINL